MKAMRYQSPLKEKLPPLVLFLALISVLISGVTAQESSREVLRIPGYQQILSFAGEPVVRIQKGDSPQWKNPEFDDSSWKTISLPSQWEEAAFPDWKGLCWYRITLSFPQEIPRESLAISLGEIFDADETYFNGSLIGGYGEVDDPGGNAFERDRIYEIPTALIRPGQENVIAIRVRGIFGQSGPIKGRFALGPEESLRQRFFQENLVKSFLGVVYLVLAAYFLLFFIRRPQEKSNLTFGLFSLDLALYTFLRTEFRYWVIPSFNACKHLEMASLLLLPALLMYFMVTYYQKKRRIYQDIYMGFSLVMALVFLFFIDDAEMRFSLNKMMQITWIIPVGTILYILGSRLKSNRDARLMFGAILVITIILILDIFSERNLINIPPLSSYGFLLFVVSMALILTNRFVMLHHQVEELNKNLEAKVEKRTEELNRALTAVKEKDARILMEMRMAGEIQNTLLPHPLPALEKISLNAHYEPFRSVSGDFYDILPLKDGRQVLLLADASGHGMPAALITILAKKSFYKAAVNSSSLKEVLVKVNQELCEVIQTDHYLTAFLCAFGPGGRVTFANAGHTQPLFYQADPGRIKHLTTGGMFVGAVPEASETYEEKALTMKPGDRILLYTDCLIEAGNGEEPYGEKRLLASFLRHISIKQDMLLKALVKDLKNFAGEGSLKDDLTLISITRRE